MRVQNLMGSGCSGQLSRNIRGTFSLAITAAGSTQGTATTLTDDVNVITTTAASTGVLLPSSWSVADDLFIANHGANTLSVYPGVGGAIGLSSTNAAVTLATGKCGRFVNTGTDTWAFMAGA